MYANEKYVKLEVRLLKDSIKELAAQTSDDAHLLNQMIQDQQQQINELKMFIEGMNSDPE